MVADILASFQKITLDHYAFYQFFQIRIIIPAVENFTDNTDLFLILFVRIGMVYIHDHGRISQIPSGIKLRQTAKILIMIIGDSLTVFIHAASQDRVGEFVSRSLHVKSTVNKVVRMLGCGYGIQHNGKIAAGGVLHPYRDIHTAGGKPVLLVFHGTCADGFIGEHVVQITAVFRVKHFIGGRQSGFSHYTDMEPADRYDAGKKVRSLVRFRLMEHSLISVSRGTGLISVNSGNDHQFIGDLI